MRTILRTITRVGQLTGLVLLAFSLGTFVLLGLGPRTGRYRTMTVLSGSMRPHFGPGAVVVVTPKPASAVRAGDVIAYQIPVEDHRVVTHRVVEVVEAGPHPVIRTKGDANPEADPWTAELTGTTAWQVRLAVPHLGLVVNRLRSPGTSRASVIVVPFLLAVLWLKDIWSPGPRHAPA